MKRSFLRGLLMNAGGSGSVAVVALVRNVLIARVMGPAAFGLWQVCLVALRLAGECHLGALHAIALDAPVHRGAGRAEAARDLERRGITAALLLSALAGVAAGAVLRIEGGAALLPAALLLAAAVVGQQWFLADALLLRTRRQFGRLAALQAVFAVVHLAGLAALVPGRFITGALLAWVLGTAGALLVVRAATRDPLPLPSPAGVRGLREVVRRGGPAWLVGVTFLVLLQVDRVVVGTFLGQQALGYYGILSVGGSVLLFLPDVVAGVLWPFAGEHFGRHGKEAASLRPVAVATLRGLALLLGAVLVFALVGTEILVGTDLLGREMRAYAPVLEAVRWYLPGIFFLALVHPLRFLLLTAGAEHEVLRAQVAVLALAVVAESIGALTGGLRGVAMAGSLCGGVLFLLVLRQVATRFGLGRGAAVLGVEVLAILAAAFLVEGLIGRFGPSPETVGGALARLAVPAALGLGIAGMLLRARAAAAAAEPDGGADLPPGGRGEA